MIETSKHSWAIAAAACVALSGAVGCAKGGKPSETARAERASGQMTHADTLRATVEAVDLEDRVIGLRDEEGHPFLVEVGDDVPLERVQPNQKVDVTYQESVEFALQDPDHEEDRATQVEQQSRRRVPNGVQFGRRVTTTVEIVEVAPEGATATFRVPEGDVRTVAVDDAKSRKKIAQLRPGDAVAVTYTEKLKLGIED